MSNKKIFKKLPQFWKDRLTNIGFTIMVLAIFMIIWVVIYNVYKDKQTSIPGVGETFRQIGLCFIEGKFWSSVGFTMIRSIIAFAASFVLAVVVNLLGKIWWPVRKFFDPVAAILRTLPTMAMTILLSAFVPTQIAPAITAFGVVFPNCYGQVKAAVDTIDPNLIAMSKIFNLSKKDRFYKIYFRQTQPYLLRCIGIDFSFAFKVMVSTECMGETKNCIGELIQKAKTDWQIPRLAAVIILSVIIAIALDLLLSQLVRVTYKWNRKED